MSSTARQFENAVNMLVDGFLREDDDKEHVAEAVVTLRRVADDWAENLDGTELSEHMPGNIWALIQEHVRELCDLMGQEWVCEQVNKLD